MARAAARKPLEIWGDGSVVRDYFYVGDLAVAAQLAATTAQSRTVYNIGSGVGRSLNDVIAAIEATTGRTLEVHRLPARPSDAPVNILDITRARQALEWSPQVSFEDGLQRTWEYYMRTEGS